ncbi:LiaF transmembrane domain-containing protein [Halosegnis marinus]|uniref:LiaF transmembrane domain-containing protein n=1 Tax=Halosegnis marinus TaxID=3034023 RepID=A0ABD5ZR32_9EURY|nr:hypothetical protein [Halosegnis sp. DT85]
MAYRRLSNSVVVGAAVALVGLVLLADTTGTYDTGRLLRYAPVLFVLAGAYALVASRFRNFFGPVLLIVVASAAQAVTLGYATVGEVLALWPLLLVAFGASLAVGTYRGRARTPGTDAAFVNALAVFGATERRPVGTAFRGADLVAAFGGVTLDLRDVERPTDGPVRVSATAVFGAAEVIVPRGWNVELDVLPVLGGVEDSRRRDPTDHDEVDLVVDGFVAFGGVELSD